MKKALVCVAALSALVAAPLLSHDFWLIPDAFRISSGADIGVNGQTSSDFPTTLSAVTVDRIASAQLITGSAAEPITGLSTAGNSLRLVHRPRTAGQAIVAVAVLPRSIPESPESFRRYLTLEGAPEALGRYEREGISPTDSITRYAKYAKTLVQVGDGGAKAYAKLAGHPFEFVPLQDPFSVSTGALRFRAVFLGQPLAHARGHASAAASRTATTAIAHAEFETDANGEFTIDVSTPGIWNVRALYIGPAPDGSGADWDVHWATFVWGVAP